jgi:Ribosome-binding factor A
MESQRLKKLDSQLQKDLAEIFRLIAQERFSGWLITVSSVRVSPDLSIARVQLSVFPDREGPALVQWANENEKAIKDRLVKRIEGRMRKMPHLIFHHDDSLRQESEIDRILRQGGESPIS